MDPIRTDMTLLDATILRLGDKVYARAANGRWKVYRVAEFLQGTGVERALLVPVSSGPTIMRGRYQIKAAKSGKRTGRKRQ